MRECSACQIEQRPGRSTQTNKNCRGIYPDYVFENRPFDQRTRRPNAGQDQNPIWILSCYWNGIRSCLLRHACSAPSTKGFRRSCQFPRKERGQEERWETGRGKGGRRRKLTNLRYFPGTSCVHATLFAGHKWLCGCQRLRLNRKRPRSFRKRACIDSSSRQLLMPRACGTCESTYWVFE